MINPQEIDRSAPPVSRKTRLVGGLMDLGYKLWLALLAGGTPTIVLYALFVKTRFFVA